MHRSIFYNRQACRQKLRARHNAVHEPSDRRIVVLFGRGVAAMVLHRQHIVRMVDVMVGMALCYATMLSMGLRPFASGPTMSRAARQQQQQQEEEEQQH